MKSKATIFVIIMLSCLVSAAQRERYSKVKIYPPSDRYERAQLIGLLEIDHFETTTDGAIISEISQSDIARLNSTPYRFEILVPDVVTYLDSVNRIYYASLNNNNGDPQSRVAFEQPGAQLINIMPTPAAFQVKPTFGGYYTYDEMIAAMDALVASFPTIAQKINLATTVNGNTLWMIKISDNVATNELNEPEVLYMGLQHAREAITGSSMIFFMQYLCERYSPPFNDIRIQNLVNNREIYIIPCFNPDGWEYNYSSEGGLPGGSWRKNRKANGGGIFGVDLNRNWGVDWAQCSAPILGPPSSCGSSSTSSDTYWGTAAFSEIETAAVRNFAQTNNLIAGFDQHAYGPYYSLPFGRQSLHPGQMPLKGQNFYTAIPALMGTYNGMRAADSYNALGYEVAGGFKDWMLMGNIGTGTKDTVWAMTGEGGAGGGGTHANIVANGTQNFWAPASEIENLSRSMCYQNLQLLYAAGSYVDIQDVNDIAVTSIAGNLSFRVQRLGLGNDPVTITLVPLENIQSVGAPVVIASMPTYYQQTTNSISYNLFPSITAGQRIRFAWRVQTGGYTYSDTFTKFYNPVQLFYDDMEGVFATNWTNTAVNVASGFGYNYTAGSWVFTASGGYNSTRALSESANGTNYSGSSIRTVQCNTIFNLADATAAYLTFWVRHEAENFRDKVQVQISVNAGVSWTAISGKTTIREPGILDASTINGQPALTGIRDYWTAEVFDLNAFRLQPAVRLRFVFTSDNDPSSFAFERDEGFFIDNVKVIKSTSTLFTLPVNFLSFSGRLTSQKTVELEWEASIDRDHSYFEVEKSSNRTSFTSIGRVDGLPPYKLIDANPFVGNNYYRVKAVDVNGHVTYSKVINITYNPSLVSVTLYPNPVKDNLHLKINLQKPERLTLQVTDIMGKVVYQQQENVASISKEIKLDVKALSSQVYTLKIKNSDGEVLSVQKFIKQ